MKLRGKVEKVLIKGCDVWTVVFRDIDAKGAPEAVRFEAYTRRDAFAFLDAAVGHVLVEEAA